MSRWDLGHRVVSPTVGAEPVGTREEVRLEDGLQHQLQGCLDHPVTDGRDPQVPDLAAGLGDRASPRRERVEGAGPKIIPQFREELVHPTHGLDVVGGLAIHTSRACTLVVPHPIPRDQQEAGIGDEVVQIIEPAMSLIAGPTVQLGLDLQYPALGLVQDRVQLVDIHQRLPGIPALLPPTCWLHSPCTRLSRARTTTEPPPHPASSTDDASIPTTQMGSEQRERPETVPVFTANRSISPASSFAPAASPRLRRRPSSWPPDRHAKSASESACPTGSPCTAPRPLSTRFEPVPRLRSFTTGSSRIPSDLARRTHPVWQSQDVPALSALLRALPGISRVGLRSAPTRLLRQPSEEVFHLLRFPAPHGAPPFFGQSQSVRPSFASRLCSRRGGVERRRACRRTRGWCGGRCR
jgi:hypothetical protein